MNNQRKNHSILKITLIILSLFFITGCNSQSTGTKTDSNQVMEKQFFTKIMVSFPAEVHPEPITGRILLFASTSDTREPRYASNFSDSPVYAIDVTNLKPEQKLAFSIDMFYVSPGSLFSPNWYIDQGTYYIQALIDLDNTNPFFNYGPGNLYSQVIECNWPTS